MKEKLFWRICKLFNVDKIHEVLYRKDDFKVQTLKELEEHYTIEIGDTL